MRPSFSSVFLALALAFVATPPVRATESKAPPPPTAEPSTTAAPRPAPTPAPGSVCDLIQKASDRYNLPVDYFTRLIWQESRFNANAQSPAGALGVAQFMPRTASERGLADPFSTPEALTESAAYLSELRQTFGNLGLAAAAYNAGPGRLSRWLVGQAELPRETLDYVEIVTGHSVDEWTARPAPEIAKDASFSCSRIATLAFTARPGEGPASGVRSKPWAVILLGNPQRDKALAEYAIVKGQYSSVLGGVQPSVVHRRISGLEVARYIVQVEHDSRASANAFCSRLLRAGGNCFVLANK